MLDFRKLLKPGAHKKMNASNQYGFYAVLRLGGCVVWRGRHYSSTYRGEPEAKQLALEDAELILACADGSLMAEDLQAIADRAVEE